MANPMPAFEMDPVIAQAGRSDMNKADLTRKLNDAFRADLAKNGTKGDSGHEARWGGVVMTPQVHALTETVRCDLMDGIGRFDDFSPENDPYEEHDFGVVSLHGERFFWKIDYYDLDLRHASPDPGDAAFTIRVMTIMRADEY